MFIRLFKRNRKDNGEGTSPSTFLSSSTLPTPTPELIHGYVRIVDRYNIVAPYCYVTIVESVDGRLHYIVTEPTLSPQEVELLKKFKDFIMRNLRYASVFTQIKTTSEGLDDAYKVVESVAKDLRVKLSEDTLRKFSYYISRDFFGYGILDPVIRDPNIEDITCNGIEVPVHVFHRLYEWLTTNIVFNDPTELDSVVRKLAFRASQEPSYARPIVEGVIKPEGYRVNIVLDVVAKRGHSFTIRKFRAEPFTIVDLIRLRTLDPVVGAYLWLAVDSKQSLIVYGPTGSGKTTLLNAVAMLLPPELKIVSAEDTHEITLPLHDNWVYMVTRLSRDEAVDSITLQTQVEAALRQRPDIIILGEIRSREAYSFFQAISTGHGGLSTIHAEDIESLIRRLISPPMNVPKLMIALVRAFVHIERLVMAGRVVRKVVEIHESLGYDPRIDEIKIQEIFRWNKPEDKWVFFKDRESSLIKAVAEYRRSTYAEVFEDLKMRATVLNWAAKKRFDLYRLHRVVREFRRDPESVYRQAVMEVGEYEI